MAEITKIEFWYDVGFIDGAVEIPALSAADPINPDITLTPTDPIVPSKDRFFSEIKIKAHYSELLAVSYMRVSFDLKDSYGTDVPHTFYGWVDSVEMVSDGTLPNTVIRWHIDEWRTWKSAVAFGSGHIKRRPFIDLDSTPIQNYPVRYYELDNSSTRIIDPYTVTIGGVDIQIWWVVVSFNFKDSYSNTTTRFLTYPVYLDMTMNPPFFKGYDGGTLNIYYGQSLRGTYEGYVDEMVAEIMGAAPEAINGIWLSPICPLKTATISGDGSYANPIDLGGVGYIPSTSAGLKKAVSGIAFVIMSYTNNMGSLSVTKTFTALKSSEEAHYVLASPDGIKLCELPYDMSIDSVVSTFVYEPDGPYIEISFKDSSYGNMIGLTVNCPLPACPLNSNAYNSYVYSGKQDYDREMRVIQSNANAWKSTTAQTAQGAMLGTFGPQGLIIGAAGGLISGLTGYGVEMLYQNDEEQRIEDRLQANQPSSLILSGNSLLTIIRGYGYCIRCIVPDSYSAGLITDTRTQFGVSVDELVTSCDTLIRTSAPTGYYNIQNLIVSGDIPVSAKRWIREKFRAGVRLI